MAVKPAILDGVIRGRRHYEATARRGDDVATRAARSAWYAARAEARRPERRLFEADARERRVWTWGDGWRSSLATAPASPITADGQPRLRRGCTAGAMSAGYRDRERQRAEAIELLRGAGAYLRLNTRRGAERWLDGPYGGREVIDPWKVAGELHDCGRWWGLRATTGGPAGVGDLVSVRCRRSHICPHCAHASAMRRADTAAELVTTVDPLEADEHLLHVTFTQADAPPGDRGWWGTLRHELDRLADAWQRVRTGAMGERWRELVAAGVVTTEVTGGASGASWHVHAHALLLVRGDVDAAREAIAELWRTATLLAERQHGASYGGWAMSQVEGGERWCYEVTGDRTAAAHQVVKYGITLGELGTPSRAAEWLQATHRRRMIRWIGRWADPKLRERAEAAAAAKRAAALREAQALGDRPAVGLPAPGRPLLSATIRRMLADGRSTGRIGETEVRLYQAPRLRRWYIARIELQRWAARLAVSLDANEEERGAIRAIVRAASAARAPELVIDDARARWRRYCGGESIVVVAGGASAAARLSDASAASAGSTIGRSESSLPASSIPPPL